ncbi:MAG: TMEM175 family protein [Candidatus Kapabacteria bacterium]|nr:TMEM175 family protein [Candidatus Kapabacteria bacterium]
MSSENPNSRLEAFCDGVFSIALTLLIIDIKISSAEKIGSTAEFWLAIKNIIPSIFTFVLSFIIILITWVNHHNYIKLINKSSSSFIYANGFLLLTVVFIPFPTSLVGEHILTNHASPAVFLYNIVIAIQGVAWVLISTTSLRNELAKNKESILEIIINRRNGYLSFIIYSLLAILSLWFPLTIAIVTTLTLIFWLIYGIKIKHEHLENEKL